MIHDHDTSIMPPPYGSARFSDDRRYRYTLERRWADAPLVCWCMLNPSTADAFYLDPTLRRCRRFSQDWGFGGMRIVNLFAWRATDPAELLKCKYPICHPGDSAPFWDNANDGWIITQSDGLRLVAAWGNGGAIGGRASAVMEMLKSRRVECLGTTKDGHPRHPLYVHGDTVLMPFAGERVGVA